MYKAFLIKYGEIGTKGKNKKDFIKCLYNNIKNSLKKNKKLKFMNRYDRQYVELNGEDPKTLYSSLNMIGISLVSEKFIRNI